MLVGYHSVCCESVNGVWFHLNRLAVLKLMGISLDMLSAYGHHVSACPRMADLIR